MNRMLRFAIILAGAIAVTAPVLAQQAAPAWPPIVSEYVAAVRTTIKTVDMDGYLKAEWGGANRCSRGG